jgi:carbamoyltransferase
VRLQTVHKDVNPLYHRLISELGQRNGIPVVLNTSFNVMGEPIVESPLDAIRCFYSTGIDALIVGNYLTTLGRTPDEDLEMLERLAMPVGILSKVV